jgi:ribosome-associated toxin RatA of RatAB toxin-antitoxin module
MSAICVEASVAGVEATDAFEAVCDLDGYPALADSVLAVRSEGMVDGRAVSHWSVSFRDGVLRWSEEDRRDDRRLTLDFDQVEGDFESFSGSWSVAGAEDGCTVRFDAAFDFGMPSIGAMLDPLAEAAIYDNVVQMLAGVFGDSIQVTSMAPAAEAGVAS